MIEQLNKNRGYLLLALLNTLVLAAIIIFIRRPEPRAVVVTTPTPRPTATQALVTVQLSGAVLHPGVYTLSAASRVSDAVELAGGTSDTANVENLNLARRLKDGEAIIIPTRVPTGTPRPALSPSPLPSSTGAQSTTPTAPASPARNLSPVPTRVAGKVNINTASLAELDTLPHIGPALGQRIIDYRMQNGSFQAIEDIKLVKGIGDAIFDEIKDRITIE